MCTSLVKELRNQDELVKKNKKWYNSGHGEWYTPNVPRMNYSTKERKRRRMKK